jgi:molecular chaperone Hsp33
MADGGNVRIILADTAEAAEEARRVHHATPLAVAAMGRTLTAALMLATELKGNGSITATISGDGPIGRICAVAWPDGEVKAYCGDPSVDLPARPDGKLDVAGAVGRGKLAVVRDLGMREPFTGQVNLVSGEIAADFAMYLAASEQQPSMVALGVHATGERVVSAGGIIVQPLPGCPEETIEALERAAPALGDISRRLPLEGVEGLVRSAFGGMDPVLSGEIGVRFRCDCSRERMERALISLGPGELADMIAKDNGAELQQQVQFFRGRAREAETRCRGEVRRRPWICSSSISKSSSRGT